MKIHFLIESLGPGGAERVAALLVNRWSAGGHTVRVVTLTDAEDDHYAVDPRAERSSIGLARAARSSMDSIRLNAERIRRLRSDIAKAEPEVVVSFLTRMNVLALLSTVGRRGRPRVVVSERSNPYLHPMPRLVEIGRRRLYPSADVVVAQTDGAAAAIRSMAPGSRLCVIPNPVDRTERATEVIDQLVVAAGRLEHTKGFDCLIHAFADVARRDPRPRLQIYGEGPDRDALEALIARLGLEGRIDLPGRYGDTRATIGKAVVFVLSSRYEGFPNVVLEALSLGVPVVSTDCDFGPRDILGTSECGWLVPVDDSDALAKAIEKALRHGPGLRAAARERAKDFDLDTVGPQWDSVVLGSGELAR